MPLYIKDNSIAEMVTRLAWLKGTTKQDAVKLAVEAELKRVSEAVSATERVKELWAKNPLPQRTGHHADKEFFDSLSGDS